MIVGLTILIYGEKLLNLYLKYLHGQVLYTYVAKVYNIMTSSPLTVLSRPTFLSVVVKVRETGKYKKSSE
jgi:hypothetical protein